MRLWTNTCKMYYLCYTLHDDPCHVITARVGFHTEVDALSEYYRMKENPLYSNVHIESEEDK